MMNYDTIPVDYMKEGMRKYLEQGVKPGSFMYALLCNDLRRTIEQADSFNIHFLREWVVWLYNEAPSPSWGSKEKVEDWLRGFGKGNAS